MHSQPLPSTGFRLVWLEAGRETKAWIPNLTSKFTKGHTVNSNPDPFAGIRIHRSVVIEEVIAKNPKAMCLLVLIAKRT